MARVASTDDGHPIYVFLIGSAPQKYLELTIQAIKFVKRNIKNANIGLISPPDSEDLTQTVIDRLKQINPDSDTENIHWVLGNKHFDDWNNAQRTLDIQLFAEEFDPIIFLHSDSYVMGDISHYVKQFIRSGKKYGFFNGYLQYQAFDEKWEGLKFIPSTAIQMYRAAALVELIPVWKNHWREWIEPAPFVGNVNPARFYKYSKLEIGQYSLSKALQDNPAQNSIRTDVYEIPRESLNVIRNLAVDVQKAKRKFLGAGSSFSNDGASKITLKVLNGKVNEAEDTHVEVKVGDSDRNTKIIHDTNEPVWNQQFGFSDPAIYGAADKIVFTLWNHPKPAPKTRSFGGPYPGVAEVTLDIVSAVIHNKHDVVGEDDPYVKINIGGVEKQTNHLLNTNTPKWNETVTFDDVVSDDAQNITISVWDWDRFTKHDLVGTTTLNLLPYNGNKQHITLSLIGGENNTEEAVLEIDALVAPAAATTRDFPAVAATDDTTTDDTKEVIGTATLSLLDQKTHEADAPLTSVTLSVVDSDGAEKATLNVEGSFYVEVLPEEEDEEESPKTRSFAPQVGGPYDGVAEVTLKIVNGVIHGKHDVVGEDDPYVKVNIGGVEKETKHVLNTNKPQWNEDLTFDDVVSDDAKNITIAVWDWDRFTSHDLIGTATLNLLPYNGNKQLVTVSLIGGEKNTEEGTINIEVLLTVTSGTAQTQTQAKPPAQTTTRSFDTDAAAAKARKEKEEADAKKKAKEEADAKKKAKEEADAKKKAKDEADAKKAKEEADARAKAKAAVEKEKEKAKTAAGPGPEDDVEYPMQPQRPNDDKLIGETVFEIESADITARPCAPKGGKDESPYIVLRFKGQELRTKVKPNTYRPTYKETLKVVNTESTSLIDVLAFVKDDAGGDHFIASTQFFIRNIDDVKTQRNRSKRTLSLETVKHVVKAHVVLAATWTPTFPPDDVVYEMVSPAVPEDGILGKLNVTVGVGHIPGRPSARDVRNGEESPFFVIRINGEEKKTQVKQYTTSSNWNEKYEFQNIQKTTIIAVWAYVKDKAGVDHFYGSGQFRVNEAFGEARYGEQGTKNLELKNKNGEIKGDISIYVLWTVPRVVPANDRNSEVLPQRRL